ncbi:MAG: restriction endonuclease [Bacteroidia bacterium]
MITRFEHDRLMEPAHVVKALHRHYGDGKPYYDLIANGVKFNQFVGVMQVGEHTIEVLPKIDRDRGSKDAQWRAVLLDMLRRTENLPIIETGEADLSLQPNHVLDLYIALFLKEVAYLMRQGLARTYRRTEGNRLALKGKLVMSRQIQENLVHAERFHVAYSTYDQDMPHNRILRLTLKVILRISNKAHLRGAVSRLLLDFPELPDISVNEQTFRKLVWNRKTEGYRRAIHIARLILLHYHPDIRGGSEHVLALMFDMNKLWEAFVLAELRRFAPEGWTVEAQHSERFWEAESGNKAHLRPDIILRGPNRQIIVLDTKWKLTDGRPTDQDLRQLFAYQHAFKADQGYLVYPGVGTKVNPALSFTASTQCHLLEINPLLNFRLNADLGKELWKQLTPALGGQGIVSPGL